MTNDRKQTKRNKNPNDSYCSSTPNGKGIQCVILVWEPMLMSLTERKCNSEAKKNLMITKTQKNGKIY